MHILGFIQRWILPSLKIAWKCLANSFFIFIFLCMWLKRSLHLDKLASFPRTWNEATLQSLTVILNLLLYSNLQVKLTEPNNSPQLKALSYYIILLPSVQAVSNYPLNIHPLANNIYSIFVKPATCRRNYKQKCNQVLMFLIRLFVAVIPISVLFGVSNLVQVVQYSGVIGFVLGFLFPTALQLQSIRVCKRNISWWAYKEDTI